MTSLTDIAPSTETVPVGGVSIPVYGVSAKGIAVLLQRFPVLKEAMTGREVDLSPDAIMKLVPDAIAAIIAAGCGSPGDPDAEATAERLPAEQQLDLLEKIIALTMPKGMGPFVERLLRVVGRLDASSVTAPGMKSPSPSKS